MATWRLFAASSADIIDGWQGRALTKQKFSIHHTLKLQSDHNKLLLNRQSKDGPNPSIELKDFRELEIQIHK